MATNIRLFKPAKQVIQLKRKEQVQSFLVASAMWLNIGIAVLLLLLSFFNFGKLETIAAGYQAISRYTQRLI